MNAKPGVPQNFPGVILGFGVGTPEAPQGAALEKNDRPYSRSVVYAEFLDIKNESFFVQSRLYL
jgi:hypothetical protein